MRTHQIIVWTSIFAEKYFKKCQFWKGCSNYGAIWQKSLALLFSTETEWIMFPRTWKMGMTLSWSSGESGLSNLVNYLKDRVRVTSVAHLCRFNLQKYKGVLSLLSKNESNYKILPCFLGDRARDLSRIEGWFCGELFYTHLVGMSKRT